MSANTIAINQSMTRFDEHDSVWMFGYGSLIYKVDFPYLERRSAHIRHWVRRFWQGSHDHRGTPQSPGRVLTLAPEQGAVCEGVAYLITPEEFAHLDYREKNGYLRQATQIEFRDGGSSEGIFYIAREDNPAYLGPASEAEIAAQIAGSRGPSGSNRDYVLQLAAALRAAGEIDPHVFAIESRLLKMP